MGRALHETSITVALSGLDDCTANAIATRLVEAHVTDAGSVSTRRARSLAECSEWLRENAVNAVILSIDAFEAVAVEQFIGSARFSYPAVPICLAGNSKTLEVLDGFSKPARDRLSHYYRVRTDDRDLADQVGIVKDLFVADAVKLRALGRYETMPGRMRSPYDVFLSYAEADITYAQGICRAIEASGRNCYLAKRSSPGTDFWDSIRNALLSARQLWLLASPRTHGSEWVISEWGTAWICRIPIVPILFQISIQQLPERLQNLVATDLHEVDRLIEALPRLSRW